MVRLRLHARMHTAMDTTTGLTLGEAARASGMDRSTIRRAIRRGALSASKDALGMWRVEPAELHRVYAPAVGPTEAVGRVPGGALGESTPDALGVTPDALIAELRAVIADLRQDRDVWRDQAQRLALPKPVTLWRWLRSSG
jgi:Helix-turn-helix domain